VIIGTCWRCEEPGHAFTDCRRPRPETRKERDKRNARHVERWQAGLITRELKRQFIALENKGLTEFEREQKRKAA
jgi:hypothetical protein